MKREMLRDIGDGIRASESGELVGNPDLLPLKKIHWWFLAFSGILYGSVASVFIVAKKMELLYRKRIVKVFNMAKGVIEKNAK